MALLIWTENLHGWAALSEWLPENPWPFVLLGVAVGMMVGLTSIGAGAIATPVLIMFLDVPPIGAVGSAIVAGAAMKAVGIWRHQQRGTVDRKLVGYLLAGSVPGVLVCRPHRVVPPVVALNAPVQGTAADIIKKAMIDLDAELRVEKLASTLLLQIHDELILEVPVEEKVLAEKMVVETMEGVAGLDVPMKVDVAWGADLASVKV